MRIADKAGSRTAHLFLMVVLLFASSSLGAQETKPLVGIIPVESKQESSYLESLNTSLTDTLELTVRFSESYRVEKVREYEGGRSVEALRDLAGREGYDTIVFGSTALLEDGGVEIRLSAYNARKHVIRAREEGRAESLLDSFSTIDTMVPSLVEGFTDSRVEYSSVEFEYAGADAQLDVYVDGTYIGTNVATIARMVAGEHRLAVKRSVEQGPVYFDRVVDLAPHTANRFTVRVPFLSDAEAAALREIDRTVSRAWGDPARREEMETAFSRALRLLGESKSVGADRLRAAYLERRMRALAFGGSREAGVPDELYALDVERELDFPTPSLASQWSDIRRPDFLPMRTIEIDGEVEDWEGIEPYVTDDSGDSLSDKRGADLRALYIAMDRKYTYVRIDTNRGSPGSNTNFWYVLSFWKPFKSHMEYSLQVNMKDRYVAEITKYNRETGGKPSRIEWGNTVRMDGRHIEARYLNSTILDYLSRDERDLPRYEYFTPQYFHIGEDPKIRDRIGISQKKKHLIYRNWK